MTGKLAYFVSNPWSFYDARTSDHVICDPWYAILYFALELLHGYSDHKHYTTVAGAFEFPYPSQVIMFPDI